MDKENVTKENNNKDKKKGPAKSRAFISSLQNSKNNIDLINKNLEQAQLRGIIAGYEWIIHDKDKNEDGTPKETHTHYVIKFRTPRTITGCGNVMGLPKESHNFIQFCHSVESSIEYLTHKNQPEKYQYPIEEVHGNIIDRDVFYQSESEAVDAFLYQVAEKGLTLLQVQKKLGGALLAKNSTVFNKARALYLKKEPMPVMRINYYISGEGGVGKDMAAEALALSLYENSGLERDEIIFDISDLKAGFNGYDGQPVIIWHDVRAADLIQKLSRSLVFDIFDSKPKRTSLNIKYSTTILINSINILTGPDDYKTFLDGLAGEYTDKSGTVHKSENKAQSYRRFPVIIEVEEKSLSILLNAGFMTNRRKELETYMLYGRITGNFKNIMGIEDKTRKEELIYKTSKPIVKLNEDVKGAIKNMTDEEIPEDFGTFIEGEWFDMKGDEND